MSHSVVNQGKRKGFWDFPKTLRLVEVRCIPPCAKLVAKLMCARCFSWVLTFYQKASRTGPAFVYHMAPGFIIRSWKQGIHHCF